MILLSLGISFLGAIGIFFIVLLIRENDENKIQNSLYRAVTMFVFSFIMINVSLLTKIISDYKDFKIGNVAPGVYCPVKNNGNYSEQCYPTKPKKKSLFYYYEHGGINPNDIRVYYPGLTIERDGELYLEVSSEKLNGKENDVRNDSHNKLASEFVKFSDVPKLFDPDIDVNSVADSHISYFDEKSIAVYGFEQNTKNPIFKHDR